jgi:hypothetical protein
VTGATDAAPPLDPQLLRLRWRPSNWKRSLIYGMDGAKPVAAGKQDLEEALLRIVQQHHHQSLCQRQQTGTVRLCDRLLFLLAAVRTLPAYPLI